MGIFVPSGSYSATTQNISSTLFCQSQKRNGQWVSAGLDLTNLTSANVENVDGHLVNQSGGTAPNGYVPGGSYTQTSNSTQVILAGLAQLINGTWQWSTLDITSLPTGTTVSNINGVLTPD